jgi:hypothetical protein
MTEREKLIEVMLPFTAWCPEDERSDCGRDFGRGRMLCTCRDDIRKSLTALESAGYDVVPREPTREMLKAAYVLQDDTALHNYGGSPTADDYWQTMLAASPIRAHAPAATGDHAERDRAPSP